MMLEADPASQDNADWLFSISEGRSAPRTDGLVFTGSYDTAGHVPEEVAVMEKARLYGARAVFFEAGRHGKPPIAQAFIFDVDDEPDDARFAELHKRLWSWGGVPLIYRVGRGNIQLFRCAHGPDFEGPGDIPVCRPIRTLLIGSQIAEQDVWWSSARIRNGTIWDDPDTCKLMLSAERAAHRTLVEEVRMLTRQLAARRLLTPGLQRRLLILSLLIAYLEERAVLLPADFSAARDGATHFFEILGDGAALVSLLDALERRFNGNVFTISDDERVVLTESPELVSYARFVQGYEHSLGQLTLWRLYSFRDLPVELISNLYQLFVKDAASSIYTPPALVRLILEEALGWERLDKLMSGDGVILDPACGSGVFLVEAYKRLVLHWRWRNNWARPSIDVLRSLLARVHGIDLEGGAIELAGFSLCLSLCDALQPDEIRSSVKLFPPLADVTLHESCFFEATATKLIKFPVAVIVGNPPFVSSLTTEGAVKSYQAYKRVHGSLADKQLAYLFLNDATDMLAPGGVLAMIEPAGFLYNQNAAAFRNAFIGRWKVREVLDFVSVRGLFKKGNADPLIVVVVAEASEPETEDRILHAVFRRNGRATAEQGFDIDYYDLHWVRNWDARSSRDIWRGNLLGGGRVRDLIDRLRTYPTLEDYARKQGWDFGEGYIAGARGLSGSADHVIGKPLLPTEALSDDGIDASSIETVPDRPIEAPRRASLFTPPLLLIKKNEDLHHGIWTESYLTFKHRVVGFAAGKEDLERLSAVDAWLSREHDALGAYIAATSGSLFGQRATAILSADIYALPYPEDEDLDFSANERIIIDDIVDHQSDFIRLGTGASIMRSVSDDALVTFDEVFTRQINAVYSRKPLRVLEAQCWSGAVCKAYVFGEGAVDWSDAHALRDRLDFLLYEGRGSSLTVTRITRLYDDGFVFLLKPNRHRFWTRSIALRDADDVLADLRTQGF